MDGSVLVRADGEVDVLNAAHFESALIEAVQTAEASIEVDLFDVTFFGSPGINALVKAYQAAARKSVALKVTAASPPVERVLKATGLAPVLGLAAAEPEPN